MAAIAAVKQEENQMSNSEDKNVGEHARLLSGDELDGVNGGLSMATYPVRAISFLPNLTAYVSNGELVAVKFSGEIFR
jgi:hypothetical protein